MTEVHDSIQSLGAATQQTGQSATEQGMGLSLLLDHLPLGVFAHDVHGRFVFVNAAAASNTGYSKSELLNLNVADIDPESAANAEVREAWRSLRPGDTFHVVSTHRRQDGSSYPAELHLTAVDLAGSRIILAVLADISDRLKAEQAQRASDERFLELLRSVPALAVQGYRDDGTIFYWNKASEVLYGYTEDEAVGKNLLDLIIPPELRSEATQAIRQMAVSSAPLAAAELTLMRKDGSRATVFSSHAVVRTPGQPAELFCVDIDLSERKRSEDALRESEQRHRDYLSNTPFGVFVIDKTGRFVQVNPAACDLAGYSEAELLSMAIADLQFPDTLQNALAQFDKLLAEGSLRTELPFRLKSGERRWWSLVAVRITPTRYLGFCSDTTEQRLVEAEVRNRDERHRTIIKTAMDGYWLLDNSGRLLDVNDTYCRMSGYSAEELLSMHVSDLEVLEGEQEVAEHLREIICKKANRFSSQHRRKDGSVFDVEVSVQYFPGESGRFVVFMRDITARNLADRALRESRELLNAILNTIPVRIFWKDRNLTYLGCNSSFAHDAGFSRPEDLVGKTDYEMAWREQADLNRADDFGVLESGEDRLLIEEQQSTPTGKKISLLTSKRPLRDGDGKIVGVLGTYYDITERKRAEKERERLRAQLTHAQKMESVGRLAGGVAHDFNNMLCLILGNTEMALSKIEPEEPLYADLQEIRKAAKRSADLVRQLLTFARKQPVMHRPLDLNEVLAGMHKLLQRLIGENIELIWIPGPDLWPIKSDSSQIDQVLANLCVNARDAIAGVGKITIETSNITLHADCRAALPKSLPGEYVLISVSDTGCGMDSLTLAQIFEPFFTTKELGKGTGLGLATVYGIVEQNAGFVEVRSQVGQGTTFEIYLPRYVAEPEQTAKRMPEKHLSSGGETILLVEDEPAILRVTARMLELQGYRVLAANGPRTAIKLANEHPGQIDLLLTDLVMPEMNGRDLAAEVCALHPSIKPIFMSGYTADVFAPHGILDENTALLQKPFTGKEIITFIREALSQI